MPPRLPCRLSYCSAQRMRTMTNNWPSDRRDGPLPAMALRFSATQADLSRVCSAWAAVLEDSTRGRVTWLKRRHRTRRSWLYAAVMYLNKVHTGHPPFGARHDCVSTADRQPRQRCQLRNSRVRSCVSGERPRRRRPLTWRPAHCMSGARRLDTYPVDARLVLAAALGGYSAPAAPPAPLAPPHL